MKLRLYKDSVRFRLRRPDVERLLESGEVSHSMRLGPAPADRWTYRLVSEDRAQPELGSGGDGLVVRLPSDRVRAWAVGPETGLRFESPWGTAVLVEKDFPCMEERPDENNDGTFPRPEGEPPACRTGT